MFVTENGNERLVAEFENPLSYLTTFNDQLFFSANENELWQSDGTNAGTRMVATGLAGIRELMVADDLLYFVADDGVHGSEVWQTDGTTAGTVLSADVLAGAIGSQPSGLVSVGDTLYFVAEDGVHGREVWSIQNQTPLAGDIDGDGSVTFADFLVLSSNFGQTTEQGTGVGDIDGNGTVGFSDFLLLSANFGR